MLEVIGNLVSNLLTETQESEPGMTKNQMENFFDLIQERFLDVNAFVRSKALQVLQKLCECVSTFLFLSANFRE